MAEEEKEDPNSEVDNAEVEEDSQKEITEEKPKAKFTFKCTRCDNCCAARGPIPITLWDL